VSELPSFYVDHEKNHKWALCGHCGIMVLCGTCGNNCCNGGHGEVNGEGCPDCNGAYEFQSEYRDEAETFYGPQWREMQARHRAAEDADPFGIDAP
jgi:hypothetical protein